MANTSGYGLLFPGPIYCPHSDCLAVGEMDIYFFTAIIPVHTAAIGCSARWDYAMYFGFRYIAHGSAGNSRSPRATNHPPNIPLFLFVI